MKIVLISTYELGRQPFGLASPAAWLRKRGHEVLCLDLSRQALDEAALRDAQLIAFYLPMHTATRLALQLIEPLRRLNSTAHFCAYGLYAPLSRQSFQKSGVESFFGGEFEEGLARLADSLAKLEKPTSRPTNGNDKIVSLARQKFEVPDRTGLVPLRQYAHLILPTGEHRTVGYTEASRGCKHLCRHCPIVPVYNGVFRIIDPQIVLADIRQQAAAGAQHITFGDPDFFNGIGHAIPLLEGLHEEFPQLTYDVTIKVEHLKQHEKHLATLRDTGCLFVTSAVESLDDETLRKLEKGHTREDFIRVMEKCRDAGLTVQPTFVPFTPWTTLDSFRDLLQVLADLDLSNSVPPIQLGIRLLIPEGSRLLELQDIRRMIGPFDGSALVYPWRHTDPQVDALCEEVQRIVAESEKLKQGRAATFERIWQAANAVDGSQSQRSHLPLLASRASVPYLNEPWYC
ncbi:MAG TPA: CUAEP/CCAEP-tail radical SAM protein [Candidatus Acidoferrum sp.]|nr:CUAEP/CCAEP-tail radical SAM protein [Candidatus Acidoferrum sp.]